MENKDTLLIRKFINLVESYEVKDNIEEETSLEEGREQGFKELLMAFTKSGEEALGVLRNIKFLRNAKSVDEAIALINKASQQELKVAMKEFIPSLKGSNRIKFINSIVKGNFAKNIERALSLAQKGNPEALKAVSKYYTEMGITGKEFAELASKATGRKTAEITNLLNKGVADASKTVKTGAEAGKAATTTVKDAEKTAAEIAKIEQGQKLIVGGGKKYHEWLKKIMDQGKKTTKIVIENGIKKVRVSKQLIQWALLAGGAYMLYSYFTDSDGSDVIVEDEGGNVVDPNLTDGMADCLRNLVDKGMGQLTTSGSGGPVVVVKKTGNPEYDNLGGLGFFMNGRVWTLDFKTKRGSWTCKNNVVQPIPEMEMNEAPSELANDVDRMIDYLDFPVSGDDLQNAKNLLQKYVNNGQGKKFLEIYNRSGLMDYPLKTTLDYIATFKASSVEAKQDMYDMIKKIESGKGGGEQGGGTADLSGISITWDGDKKPEPTPPVPIPPVPQPEKYRYCDKFPFTFGCKNPKIQDVQRCLGMESKYQTGNFGPLTLSVMRNKFGMDVIDELTYNGIMSKCKGGTPTPTTGNTTTTGSTITPPKPAEPTKPTEPTKVEPANVGSATKTTTLNRESCKSLFKTIDERDQQQGVATASKTEREQLKFCLQQYNFGVGTGASRMKRRYGLTASGGDRGIK